MLSFFHPLKLHDVINPYIILFLLINIPAMLYIIVDSLEIQTSPNFKMIYWSEKEHPLLFTTFVHSVIAMFLTYKMKTSYLFYPVTKTFIYCYCIVLIIVYAYL